jgi:mono/diheme cytochrome c family protein
MPSEAYAHFSDEDLGSIIAFIESLPPVDNRLPMRRFKYMAQVMAGAGMFGNLFAYQLIDHESTKNIKAPPKSNSPHYGEYVLNFAGCVLCHAPNLGGGPAPDPNSPIVPDISTSGNFGKWSLEEFMQTFRTGKTPEGKALNAEFMPFSGIAALEDVEIEALYNYIKSLPPAKPEE